MSIQLHIEELVLEGVELGANGAHDFERAVQARLAELLKQPLDVHERGASTLTLASHINATALGTSVAESVYAALPGVAQGAVVST